MSKADPAQRYVMGSVDRQPYLDRARNHAKVTIPALFPEQGHNKSIELYTPYQSMGARGLNNTASKLLLALYPPNAPNFKLAVDEMTAAKLSEGSVEAQTEINKQLGVIERHVASQMEGTMFRTQMFEVLKQLLVAGNVGVLRRDRSAQLGDTTDVWRVFKLNQYVIWRDGDGTLLEWVIEEETTRASLDAATLDVLNKDVGMAMPSEAPTPSDQAHASRTEDQITIYSQGVLVGNMYHTRQVINGREIPGTQGIYPFDKCPFLALRMVKVDGEDYGRAYVEEYYGDLYTLECLYQAMTDVAAIMARIVIFNDPAGTTNSDDIIDARSGDVIDGNKNDVGVLQIDKYPDLQYVKALADEISQRLGYAFLLNTAVQRGGERVTAEEIRYVARELEDVLGGVYSVLAQELQLPVIRLQMHSMTKRGMIPKLPKEVQTKIVTGLEALGRGHDLNKLDQLLGPTIQLFGPDLVKERLNPTEYMTRRANALGINTDGLIRSEEEVQAARAQAQQAATTEQMIQPAAQLAGKAMETAQQ